MGRRRASSALQRRAPTPSGVALVWYEHHGRLRGIGAKLGGAGGDICQMWPSVCASICTARHSHSILDSPLTEALRRLSEPACATQTVLHDVAALVRFRSHFAFVSLLVGGARQRVRQRMRQRMGQRMKQRMGQRNFRSRFAPVSLPFRSASLPLRFRFAPASLFES